PSLAQFSICSRGSKKSRVPPWFIFLSAQGGQPKNRLFSKNFWLREGQDPPCAHIWSCKGVNKSDQSWKVQPGGEQMSEAILVGDLKRLRQILKLFLFQNGYVPTLHG